MSYHKSIFENSPFPCLLFEKNKDLFVIKEVNALYCKVTNKTKKELKGKVGEEVFPENPSSSGLKYILDSLNKAYANKEPHKIDVLRYDLYDNKIKTFDLRYWEVENIPIFDETEHVWYILICNKRYYKSNW